CGISLPPLRVDRVWLSVGVGSTRFAPNRFSTLLLGSVRQPCRGAHLGILRFDVHSSSLPSAKPTILSSNQPICLCRVVINLATCPTKPPSIVIPSLQKHPRSEVVNIRLRLLPAMPVTSRSTPCTDRTELSSLGCW